MLTKTCTFLRWLYSTRFRNNRYINAVLDWYREDAGDLRRSESNAFAVNMTALSASRSKFGQFWKGEK